MSERGDESRDRASVGVSAARVCSATRVCGMCARITAGSSPSLSRMPRLVEIEAGGDVDNLDLRVTGLVTKLVRTSRKRTDQLLGRHMPEFCSFEHRHPRSKRVEEVVAEVEVIRSAARFKRHAARRLSRGPRADLLTLVDE